MKDTDSLLELVLHLPERDRAKIAAKLLDSLDPGSDVDVEEAWAAEIERRCAAVDAGTVTTSDWSEVRARIEKDILGR
jgi:putative addiction module component (TIGR02574 family)